MFVRSVRYFGQRPTDQTKKQRAIAFFARRGYAIMKAYQRHRLISRWWHTTRRRGETYCMNRPEVKATPFPIFRVLLFGEFTVERLVSTTSDGAAESTPCYARIGQEA